MQSNSILEVEATGKQFIGSPETEEALLGSIFIDPDCLQEVMTIVKPVDFSQGIHGSIYGAITQLAQAGEEIDFITVENLLVRKGITHYRDLPIIAYMSGFINVVPTALHARSYANIVYRDSLRRQLVGAAGKISSAVYANELDPRQLLTNAEGVLDKIGSRLPGSALKSSSQVATEFIDQLQSEAPLGLSTGYIALDAMIGGLEKGYGYWFPAAEKMGKTSFINGISLHAAKNGYSVVRISAEMAATQRMLRDVSNMTGIPIENLKRRNLSSAQMTEAMTAVGQISTMKLETHEARGVTPSMIKTALYQANLKHGRVDLLEIDYFQLLQADNPTNNRVTDLETISRQLVDMIGPKDFNLPMIITAQLVSKSIDKRDNKRPLFSDIYGSSAPMRDAFFLAFVYRDEYYHPDTTTSPGQAEIIVRAHRDGAIGSFNMRFLSKTATFRNALLKRNAKVTPDQKLFNLEVK